jgi:hypothetical protein
MSCPLCCCGARGGVADAGADVDVAVQVPCGCLFLCRCCWRDLLMLFRSYFVQVVICKHGVQHHGAQCSCCCCCCHLFGVGHVYPCAYSWVVTQLRGHGRGGGVHFDWCVAVHLSVWWHVMCFYLHCCVYGLLLKAVHTVCEPMSCTVPVDHCLIQSYRCGALNTYFLST